METVELRDLLVAARVGDQNAWDTIVERFMPLVLSVARRFRLPAGRHQDRPAQQFRRPGRVVDGGVAGRACGG